MVEELHLPEVPESAPIYDQWERAAHRMMTQLWKHKHAWIFHEPVNPEKLNIPDYLVIIKEPMDFGTIKRKLKHNEYLKCDEFIYDVNLVFNNCIVYNGESNNVTILCKEVMKEYNRQYELLYMDYYLNK